MSRNLMRPHTNSHSLMQIGKCARAFTGYAGNRYPIPRTVSTCSEPSFFRRART